MTQPSASPAPKKVLVTGGTSGIGNGIAQHFARLGSDVIVTGLTQAECGRAELTGAMRAHPLDVRDMAAVKALIDPLPRLDVLVNCAGMIQRAGKEFDIDGFMLTLDVNLTGTMRCCVAAHPKLKISGGSIINIASILTFQGSGFAPAYAASKGGIGQLTKSLAAAWAGDGVRVNAIAPGYIATDLTQALRDDETRNAFILSRTPMNRWGTPDDLAGVVAFIASDAARFMTGAIVPVDGGYLAI